MTYHVQFSYSPQDRERLLRFLSQGGKELASGVKMIGRWLSVQTGTGFVVLETDDAAGLHELCGTWSEYVQLTVTPVVEAEKVV